MILSGFQLPGLASILLHFTTFEWFDVVHLKLMHYKHAEGPRWIKIQPRVGQLSVNIISIRPLDCVPLIHNVRSCTLTVISCLHLIGVENRLVDRDGSKRRSDGKQKKAMGIILAWLIIIW